MGQTNVESTLQFAITVVDGWNIAAIVYNVSKAGFTALSFTRFSRSRSSSGGRARWRSCLRRDPQYYRSGCRRTPRSCIWSHCCYLHNHAPTPVDFSPIPRLITPPPVGTAEYCDERVWLSVASTSLELHTRSSPSFVHVTRGRGYGPPLAVLW